MILFGENALSQNAFLDTLAAYKSRVISKMPECLELFKCNQDNYTLVAVTELVFKGNSTNIDFYENVNIDTAKNYVYLTINDSIAEKLCSCIFCVCGYSKVAHMGYNIKTPVSVKKSDSLTITGREYKDKPISDPMFEAAIRISKNFSFFKFYNEAYNAPQKIVIFNDTTVSFMNHEMKMFSSIEDLIIYQYGSIDNYIELLR